MVITMPASLATLFEVAMAAEGLGFECVGECAGTIEYIVTNPIEHIPKIVSKAAADAIEVVITDEAKGSITLGELVGKLDLLEIQVPPLRATRRRQSGASYRRT